MRPFKHPPTYCFLGETGLLCSLRMISHCFLNVIRTVTSFVPPMRCPLLWSRPLSWPISGDRGRRTNSSCPSPHRRTPAGGRVLRVFPEHGPLP